MQQVFFEEIRKHIDRNRYRRIFRKCVQMLCCVVVFCTTYALILPAITMEQTAFCGLEEHTHSEACYQAVQKTQLICTEELLQVHTHSDSCYDADANIVCGQADYVAHTHNESCWQDEQLVCPLPERGAHVHGDACYVLPETEPPVLHVHAEQCYTRQQGELVCETEEYEGHAHSDACYAIGETLECELTENHVHGEGCYEYPLNCTLSTEPHNHDDGCYGTGGLLCAVPENHVHGEGCTVSNISCESEEEGHEHGEGCYTTEVVCDIPEGHSHSASCYESIVVCGKAEGEHHEHGGECYAAEPECICPLPENHVHEDSCYALDLICTVPEDPGHHHEDACYQWEDVLSCGLEDGQPEPTEPPEPVLNCTEPVAQTHVHGEACFVTVESEPAPICGNFEEDHEHTDACYGCGLEEHTHTLACYSDREADVESEAVWKSTFAHVALTGDPATDVVAIAQTQIGYTESTRNYEVWEDNSIHGYTRYGAWYGVPYGDWCGMFASFCLRYAGVNDIPINYGVRPWIDDLASRGLYYGAGETQPQKGNLIFFDWEGDGLADHVGIVAEVHAAQEHTGDSITAIEGNSSNCVKYVYYSPDDPVILGYGLLPGQERVPVDEEELEEAVVYFCGLEEHVHAEQCHDDDGNLLCQIAEHSHTDTCLEEQQIYYCGFDAHTHSTACYDASGQLICGLEEHAHAEACTVNTSEVFIESSTESVTVTYSAVRIETMNTMPAVAAFRMFAVSPMLLSNEGLTSQSEAIDLQQYITSNHGTITLSLWTMDNKPIENNQIESDKQYQLSLFFDLPEESGMLQGTYEYALPQGFKYTTQSGLLYDSTKQVQLGEWRLQEDGKMIFEFNEESNEYQDISMTATIRTSVDENVTEIPFNGQILVVINPSDQEPVPTKLVKHGEGQVQQEDGTWVKSTTDAERIKWVVDITPGTNGIAPGTLFKDMLTSDQHYFSDSDKAEGITIGFSDAGQEWHQIKIPQKSVTWHDDTGFEFLLPTANCEFCLNEFVMYEDRLYYMTYYTTVNDGLDDGAHVHENDILVDNHTTSGSLTLQVGTPSAYIVKTGRLDPATQNFKWNIETKIPAYNGGQAYAITIGDQDVIVDLSQGWDVKKWLDFNEETFESVTATVDGVEINVPYIDNATANDLFSYAFNNGDIVIGNRCTCSENLCAYQEHLGWCDRWPLKEPFCKCWTFDKDVTFNINLVYDGEAIIDEFGGQGLDFENSVTLHGFYYTGKDDLKDAFGSSSKDAVLVPGMFDKKIVHKPNSDNNFIASFKITVNDGKTDLSQTGDEISIIDKMSDTLYYIPGTMVITQVPVNGQPTTLVEGIDYDMTVSDHTITIDLNNPGPYQYILDYDAQFYYENNDQANQPPTYENYASVHIASKEYGDGISATGVVDYTYTALQYEVTLHKTSSATKSALPGAEFGLFSDNGVEIARDTTNSEGEITFKTDLNADIVFKVHHPYYLQETNAPPGYILDETKHWFFFCPHQDACTKCAEVPAHEEMVRITNTQEDKVTINVENTFGGPILPNTGGVGGGMYTVGGTLLMLAALILLYNQKKYRKEDFISS